MYIATTNTFPGHWGRGETPEEAASNMPHGRVGLLIRIDDAFTDPWVDEFGRLWADIRPEYLETKRSEWPSVNAEAWKVGPRGKRTPVNPATFEEE